MSHQCPFPVRSTDSRFCYRAGSYPGFTLCLALVAALTGYAGFSHAVPVAATQTHVSAVASSAEPALVLPTGAQQP